MRLLLKAAAVCTGLLLSSPLAACAFHFGSFNHDAVQVTSHEDQPLWVQIPPMIPAEANQANSLPIRYERNREQAVEISNLSLTASGSSILNGQTGYLLDGDVGEVEIPLIVSRAGFQLVIFTLSGTLHHPGGSTEPFELQSRTTILAR